MRYEGIVRKRPTKQPGKKPEGALSAPNIEGFLGALEHPQKPAILRLSELLLSISSEVTSSVKWNAPSFARHEHFATFQLRAKTGVMLVMHFGAKKRTSTPAHDAIPDPAGLLSWLAPDRASITFADLADVEAKQESFVAVARAWLQAMDA